MWVAGGALIVYWMASSTQELFIWGAHALSCLILASSCGPLAPPCWCLVHSVTELVCRSLQALTHSGANPVWSCLCLESRKINIFIFDIMICHWTSGKLCVNWCCFWENLFKLQLKIISYKHWFIGVQPNSLLLSTLSCPTIIPHILLVWRELQWACGFCSSNRTSQFLMRQ